MPNKSPRTLYTGIPRVGHSSWIQKTHTQPFLKDRGRLRTLSQQTVSQLNLICDVFTYN